MLASLRISISSDASPGVGGRFVALSSLPDQVEYVFPFLEMKLWVIKKKKKEKMFDLIGNFQNQTSCISSNTEFTPFFFFG